jgi:hypothetical protein
MPKLSDDEMRAIREIMARRRARSKDRTMIDHPVKREVMANLVRYEIKQVQERKGLTTIDSDHDLAKLRERLQLLGRKARAMIYAVGRMPSRGPDAMGSWPVDEDEIYS